MKISSLGYVGVGGPRAGEWAKFGPEILGTPLWTEAAVEGVYLRLDERAYRIAVHPAARDELQYVGWEVSGPAALEEAAADLGRAGLAAARGSADECRRRAVEGLVVFRDPWGLRHELFYGQRSLLSFRPTRDISGFVTGGLGMGHVVLVLPELAAATRFFVDTFGFRLSDFIDLPFPLAFFHCNPRHHTLAVGQMGPMVGLHHVMLEVKDLNDVGTTYELCKKSGVPLSMDLGRHSNDRMLSFYVRTPGGFEIEYGWGGLLIDDAAWQVLRLPKPSYWGHELVNPAPPTTIYPVG
ncbi:MAG: VOC family protein [Deltaproteobacteria bacterium]|nr:VOC family protein [Deltaproteobacteria bacterium]